MRYKMCRSFQEHRGKYNITCYEIDITDRMKECALDFAQKIIRTDNQYSRLLPTELQGSTNLNQRQKIEIQRTYVGKLGEIAFSILLKHKKNIRTDYRKMFEIYEGETNVDSFDFNTKNDKTVDIP